MRVPKIEAMKKAASCFVAAGLWIAAWQLACAVLESPLILPPPLAVLRSLARLLGKSSFYAVMLRSGAKIMLGFAAGILAALASVLLCLALPRCEPVARVPIVLAKTVPAASFILMLFVWMPASMISSAAAFLISLPVVFEPTFGAASRADKELLEMSKVFRVPRVREIVFLRLPCAKESFKRSISVAAGLSWKAGIAAEVICSPKMSVGSAMRDAKIYLETDELFAWTAAAAIASVLIGKIAKKLLSR